MNPQKKEHAWFLRSNNSNPTFIKEIRNGYRITEKNYSAITVRNRAI